MRVKLLLQTCIKFIFGLVFVGLLLFLPAGTFKYRNAWLLIGLLFIPMFFVAVVLFLKNPKLLEKRLKGKEKESTQKNVIILSIILFVLGFLVAGFDFKYEWSNFPEWLTIISSIIWHMDFI